MKKKVSLVTMNPYFNIGNANSAVSIYLKTIGNFLESKGYEVSYYPTFQGNTFISTNSPKGVMYRIKKSIKFLFPKYYFNKRFTQYFKDVENLHYNAEDFLKDSEIIIEFSSYGGNIGSRLKKKYSNKVVTIFDAPLPLQFEEMYHSTGIFSNILAQAESNFVNDSNLIICYSDEVRLFIEKNYRVNCPIVVLPCIVWKKEILPLDNGKPIIGFIGSFLTWHKPLLLVKAFERIAPEFPEAHLLMIGFGEEWGVTNQYCLNSPFKNRIKLTGFVSELELTKLKSTFTVGVMPGSNWYGSPLKLFEYADNGIPVIAPSTPTVKQYFKHNENALLIDANNELNDLVLHLRTLLNDPNLRNRLAQEGLRRMKGDLSMENVMTSFVKEIEKI